MFGMPDTHALHPSLARKEPTSSSPNCLQWRRALLLCRIHGPTIPSEVSPDVRTTAGQCRIRAVALSTASSYVNRLVNGQSAAEKPAAATQTLPYTSGLPATVSSVIDDFVCPDTRPPFGDIAAASAADSVSDADVRFIGGSRARAFIVDRTPRLSRGSSDGRLPAGSSYGRSGLGPSWWPAGPRRRTAWACVPRVGGGHEDGTE